MEDLRMVHRRVSIIGYAMTASLFAYLLVVNIISRTGASFEGLVSVESRTLLGYAFYFISLSTFMTAWFLYNRQFRSEPAQPGVSGGPRPKEQELLQRLTSVSIVILALSESIAIWGLVAFFVTGDTSVFFILLAASFLSFLIFFPRYSQWETWMKQRELHY